MSEQIIEKISEYLKVHNYLNLATVNGEGQPSVATVSYVSDGPVVFFITDENTRKVANLTGNPNVAYTVDEDYTDWMAIQGIQVEGKASEVTDREAAKKIMDLFMEKFPAVKYMPADFAFKTFRIDPTVGFSLDNKINYGHRDKVTF
jgi:uncharacterized protein